MQAQIQPILTTATASVGDYEYKAKIFNITVKAWSDGSSYISNMYINLQNMYYNNDCFYSYGKSVSGSNRYVVILTYDAFDQNWNMQYFSSPYIGNYTLYHICAQDNYIFFKVGYYLLRCDLQSGAANHVSMGTNIFPIDKGVKGFCLNEKTYFYTNTYLCEFDFSTASVIKNYTYPFTMNSRKDKIQKCNYNEIYYFDEDNGAYKIYKFNPANEEPWEITSYRIFDNDDFHIIMGWDFAYLTLGYKSGLYEYTETEYYDTAKRNLGGFEKMSLPADNYQTRIKTDNVYNEYNQLISTTKTVFKGGKHKVLTEEQTTYIAETSAVLTQTDALGNVTAYDYTDSTYYIPVSITEYSGTDNAVTTTNTLSEDKTKILNTVTSYDDRSLKTVYSYDLVYPANIVSEQAYEIKNGEETLLNQKEYVYDSAGMFVISEKLKNIVTYGTDFTIQTPSDITLSYQYDNMGRLVAETDAKNNTTSYTYNKNGWITQITYPDNSFEQKTYTLSDGTNEIRTSYDNKYITADYYNGLGQLEERTEFDGNTQKLLGTYIYAYNNLVGIMMPDSSIKYYEYDYLNRTTTISTLDENHELIKCTEILYDDYEISQYAYDGRGKTTYYDNVGRIIKEEQATDAGLNSVSYEYDYQSNVNKITNALGAVTTNSYNDMGQLVSVTNSLNQPTSYEYDKWGNVSKITYSGGNTVSYLYDNAGRLLRTTDVLEKSEYYAYDTNGNLTKYKDKKNQITTNTYDSMNRLVSKQVGSKTFGYTYDSLGNQLSMSDGTGTTEYEYTYNNRLAKITTPNNKSISYIYDFKGNVTSINDYAGNSYSYTFDSADRLTKVQSGNSELASYTYTVYDAVESVTTPEFTSTYTYDNAGRMISQTNSVNDNTVINSYNYTYDLTGNQIKKEETSGDALNVTNYNYDVLGRLTSEQEPDGTMTAYTFDTAGNIASKSITHPTSYEYSYIQSQTEQSLSGITDHSYTYTYNSANRLLFESESVASSSTTIGITRSYTYDNNGNTVQMTVGGQVDPQTSSYAYDELNQLVSYTASNGTVTTYGYDGNGMRISKAQEENTTKFYWDRGCIVNEGTGNSITVSNYIGIDGVFARKQGNTTDYYLKNGHGDIIQVMRAGEAISTYDYDAYGNQKELTISDTNPYRYCGEYTDSESGLIYLRARYYDPEICRFISEDPIMDGSNWYSYCNDNPIMFADPWGMDARVDGTTSDIFTSYLEMQALTDDTVGFCIETGELVIVSYFEGVPDKPAGTELVRGILDNKDFMLTIRRNSVNPDTGNKWGTQVISGNRRNAIININDAANASCSEFCYVEVDVKVYREYYKDIPTYIFLGHEMIHAQHHMQGTFNKINDGTMFYRDEYGIGHQESLRPIASNNDEYETLGIGYISYIKDPITKISSPRWVCSTKYHITENVLRKEHGLRKRIAYRH